MIDDETVANNIRDISKATIALTKKIIETDTILSNAFCYLELQFEKGLEFRKKEALYGIVDALQTSDDALSAMSGNHNFTEKHLKSFSGGIELMELLVIMHKNAVRTNDVHKKHLEMLCSACHWLLQECKSQNISIPKGYYLSKLVQKEGFAIKYPKPIDQLHGEEPTFDVTECEDLFYFSSKYFVLISYCSIIF